MLVIGTFEHSLELEQALAELETGGISRRNILVIPMDTDPSSALQYLGSPPDRYLLGIEVGMAVATASSVIGTSIGFILPWGPVFWGLFGGLIGFGIGFGLYRLINKKTRSQPQKCPEVAVIVECPETQAGLIMQIMWQYRAFSVGRSFNQAVTK